MHVTDLDLVTYRVSSTKNASVLMIPISKKHFLEPEDFFPYYVLGSLTDEEAYKIQAAQLGWRPKFIDQNNRNKFLKKLGIQQQSMEMLIPPLQNGQYCSDFAVKDEKEPYFGRIAFASYPDGTMMLHDAELLAEE
jgi:hypothetical protein